MSQQFDINLRVEAESKDFTKELCFLSLISNVYIERFKGNMQDNYIFYNTSSVISVGRRKTRKYIIIKEKNLNNSEVIMTNNAKLVKQYKDLFIKGDVQNENI